MTPDLSTPFSIDMPELRRQADEREMNLPAEAQPPEGYIWTRTQTGQLIQIRLPQPSSRSPR